MGNLLFKSKKSKNYKQLTNRINKSYSGDIDYNTSIELFDIDNITNIEEFNSFKEEIIKTISHLQNNLEQTNNKMEDYDKNIYKINEQVDLIHKDLKCLLDNDKILNEKINSLIEPPSVI